MQPAIELDRATTTRTKPNQTLPAQANQLRWFWPKMKPTIQAAARPYSMLLQQQQQQQNVQDKEFEDDSMNRFKEYRWMEEDFDMDSVKKPLSPTPNLNDHIINCRCIKRSGYEYNQLQQKWQQKM